ncbi:MAG: TIGR02300 family protein [Alphaproteobacteria bacterium]|nr:TIGR02300 family protein [Alphaproteobacteria bacterium]
MAKPEWGEKRTCLDCGAKFYDMQRSPIVCPTCDTEFVPVVTGRSSRAKAPAPAPKPEPKKPAVADEDAALVTDDDDEEDLPDDPALDILDDDALIEDASDLGGADDVLDGIEGGPEKPDDPASS